MNYIQHKIKDRIGVITLNRPEKRNALNGEMVKELKDRLSLFGDAPSVKIILIKANGPAFSAGADLAYLQQLQKNTKAENFADSKGLMALFQQIYTFPKLVIAQVEGAAIAGGCGLATVCDLCFAAPEAVFGYSEVKIGFIPALVSVFLCRKIGEGHARAFLLTGKSIPATEALDSGLITAIFPKEQIKEKVWEKALKLCSQTSEQAIALTKELLVRTQGMKLDDALTEAAKYNANARATEDCKKGIQAFLAKEKIKW